MQDIIYRQLFPADHDEYKRIRLECLKLYPDNFGSTYEEELNSKSLKLTGAIKSTDDHNFVFGAFTKLKKLIGICGFVSETRIKTRHRGEIVQMFVDPGYKGMGIGRELLKQTINKAFDNDETNQIILSAVSANTKALKLYTQMGFVEYGKLENYFRSGSQYSTQSFFYLSKEHFHK